MSIYIFIISLITLISFMFYETYFRIRKKKVKIKSMKIVNKRYLTLSLFWFYISLLNFKILKNLIQDGNSISNKYLYFSIIYAIIGLLWLIKSLLRDMINDYGICTTKGNYKWEKINHYEWGKLKKKGNKEYIDINFYIKNNKLNRYYYGEDYRKINIKINRNSKEELQSLLENKLIC